MRDAVDEIIRGHVRPHAGGARSFLWPGEMAVVTVKFLGQHVDVGEEADEEIRQRGFVGVLRIVDAKGMAFGTTNGAGDSFFGGVPVLQLRVGSLKFVGRNVEARAVNAGAVVKFRGDSRILQSPLERFAV